MINQKEISKFAKGDQILHFFLLKKCDILTSKNNKNYLALELGDKSGSITAFKWDDFEKVFEEIKIGDIIKVAGEVDEFNSKLNIKIAKLRKAEEGDEITTDDFVPKSKRDFLEMKKDLLGRIERISNKYIKQLINITLKDSDFDKYLRVPAGKAWHHAYIHGLLEHTLEIIKICDLMCDIHSEINRDLLIAGAIFHDFGKVEELTFDGNFDYSDKGRLIGHIVISAMAINEKAKEITGFPEELKDQIIHLVLSHQGKLEHASPVVPKMLEAIVLYHADELSAKTNAYKGAIENEANGKNNWTKFLQLASTSLFIPEGYGSNYDEPKNTLFD